jgi:hypothetical protein
MTPLQNEIMAALLSVLCCACFCASVVGFRERLRERRRARVREVAQRLLR